MEVWKLSRVLSRLKGSFLSGVLVVVPLIITYLVLRLLFDFVDSILAPLLPMGDRLLNKMPVIRSVYSSAKQLMEAVTQPTMKSFREVALIEYPRLGNWSVGFVANRVTVVEEGRSREMVTVFIASTPTPITGMLVLVPATECIILRMTVEEAIKFLVSGGVVSPEKFEAVIEPAPQQGDTDGGQAGQSAHGAPDHT